MDGPVGGGDIILSWTALVSSIYQKREVYDYSDRRQRARFAWLMNRLIDQSTNKRWCWRVGLVGI